MGRKKLELKKRENPKARKATFTIWRKGLFKKAKELSIMCDAEVGVIIFSEANDITHFPNKNTFDDLIAKYNTHRDKIKADQEKPPLELIAEEVERLRKKCDEQELIISQMDCNKEFGNLLMEELSQIERRMQNGLNLVREKQREQYEKTNIVLQRRVTSLSEMDKSFYKFIAKLIFVRTEEKGEHNEKTIAELRQAREQYKKTNAELQRRIQLMEGNGKQKQEAHAFFPEVGADNGSSAKGVS